MIKHACPGSKEACESQLKSLKSPLHWSGREGASGADIVQGPTKGKNRGIACRLLLLPSASQKQSVVVDASERLGATKRRRKSWSSCQ